MSSEPAILQPWSSGDGRVRVKSSARAGGLLAGVTPLCGTAFGVRAGLRMRFYGGGLPVTPAGLWDLSPFYSLAPGPDL